MKRVLVMASVTFLGLSAARQTRAQSAAILGRDDVQFALHLVRSGHPDLADGACRVLLHSGSCETAVLSHAARARTLADVDRDAIRSAVAASPRHAERKGTSLRPLGWLLYTAGRRLLGVPEDVAAFLDWDRDPARAAELGSDAASLLGAARELGDPSDEVTMAMARLYRLLGNPAEAALLYEEMFRQMQFMDPKAGHIYRGVLRSRPELVVAYLEWGVLQRQLAAADEGDRKRFAPCLSVFDHLGQTLDRTNPIWWLGRREQILTFLDMGEKKIAQMAMRSLERTTDPEQLKQHGFDALRERLR